MRIYYRGYVINKEYPQRECTVEGRRPERQTLVLEDNLRAAMRWIDHDVIRQQVVAAGWLSPRVLVDDCY